MQIILDTFETILDNDLVLQVLKGTINLVPIDAFCMLGNQHIIERVLL